jgi:hypothetical protein
MTSPQRRMSSHWPCGATKGAMIMLGLLVSGCRGSFEFPALPSGGAQQSVVVVPEGDEAIVPNASGPPTTILPEHQCFVRARHFQGLVQRPCASVASETRG